MRVLAGIAGIPVWLAGLLSITLCCGGNFLASDQWVFLSDRNPGGVPVGSGR